MGAQAFWHKLTHSRFRIAGAVVRVSRYMYSTMPRSVFHVFAVVSTFVVSSWAGHASNQSMLRGSARENTETNSTASAINTANVTSSSNGSTAQAQIEDVFVGASLSGGAFVGTITSAYDSKCLFHRTSHWFDQDDDRIQVRHCHAGWKSQKWMMHDSVIKNFDSNLCLEVYRGWKFWLKGEVFAQECQQGKRSQMWSRSQQRNAILSLEGGATCLTVRGTSWVNVAHCYWGTNQQWFFHDLRL